jgi:hypothetical protein
MEKQLKVSETLYDMYQQFIFLQDQVLDIDEQKNDILQILLKEHDSHGNSRKRKRELDESEYKFTRDLFDKIKKENTFEEFVKSINKFMIERHF